MVLGLIWDFLVEALSSMSSGHYVPSPGHPIGSVAVSSHEVLKSVWHFCFMFSCCRYADTFDLPGHILRDTGNIELDRKIDLSNGSSFPSSIIECDPRCRLEAFTESAGP